MTYQCKQTSNSSKLRSSKELRGVPVKITPQISLNTCKKVIRSQEVATCCTEEIVRQLRTKTVTNATIISVTVRQLRSQTVTGATIISKCDCQTAEVTDSNRCHHHKYDCQTAEDQDSNRCHHHKCDCQTVEVTDSKSLRPTHRSTFKSPIMTSSHLRYQFFSS